MGTRTAGERDGPAPRGCYSVCWATETCSLRRALGLSRQVPLCATHEASVATPAPYSGSQVPVVGRGGRAGSTLATETPPASLPRAPSKEEGGIPGPLFLCLFNVLFV